MHERSEDKLCGKGPIWMPSRFDTGVAALQQCGRLALSRAAEEETP